MRGGAVTLRPWEPDHVAASDVEKSVLDDAQILEMAGLKPGFVFVGPDGHLARCYLMYYNLLIVVDPRMRGQQFVVAAAPRDGVQALLALDAHSKLSEYDRRAWKVYREVPAP